MEIKTPTISACQGPKLSQEWCQEGYVPMNRVAPPAVQFLTHLLPQVGPAVVQHWGPKALCPRQVPTCPDHLFKILALDSLSLQLLIVKGPVAKIVHVKDRSTQ